MPYYNERAGSTELTRNSIQRAYN